MKKIILSFLFCTGILALVFFSTSPKPPYVTLVGRVEMADGLGKIAIDLAHLFRDQVSLTLIPTLKHSRDVPKDIKRLIRKKEQKIGTVLLYQEPLAESIEYVHPQDHPHALRIAYSMFESTRIPPNTVEMLNRFFDVVVVPDRFLIPIYQNSGVTRPIFELPLCRDFKRFLDSPLKSKSGTPFTFAALGAGRKRKNLPTLIRAFHKAFGTRSDVRLLINCRYLWDTEVEQELQKIQSPNIVFSQTSLNEQTYFDLFQEIDCYVNIAKGEGFSVQPREAMAMGIPTIVTDNTAQHTLCETGLVRVVPSPHEEPAIFEFYDCTHTGVYFGCEENAVVEALLDVESNYPYYLEKGAQAREWVTQYDLSQLKSSYTTLIKPKRVILGTENRITEDTLITDSEELFFKYQAVLKSLPQADQ